MKFLKINILKGTLLIAALCAISGALYLKWAYDGIPVRVKSFQWEQRVVARSVMRLSNFVFTTTDEGRVLFVDGKRYTRLMGGLPFYLEAPNKQFIVFVTEGSLKKPANDVMHIYNLDSKKVIDIPCEGFSFGYGIRDGRDKIVSLDGGIMTLLAEGTSVSTTIKLDLSAQKIVSIENLKRQP
jgi:hypothetical protein